MNNIKLHIGIIVFLSIGLLSFYMSKDDISYFKNVQQANKQIQKSNQILVRSSDYRIRELEELTYKQPYLKPLVEQTKQLEEICGEFHNKLNYIKHKIFNIENEYYAFSEEEGFQWKESINYPHIDRSKKEAQLIIKNTASEFSEAYQNLDSLTTELLKDTTNLSTWNEKGLTNFQNRNLYLRDSLLHILRNFESKETLIHTLSRFDIIHYLLFFESCQQELILLENKLLNNYCEFAAASKISFQKPNKYAIIMSQESAPIVGKPFKADFFVTAYIDSDNLTMRVNGREIPVKDGVGTYDFMPKKSGLFNYKVDISYKHPLTNKIDNYGRTFKLYVP